MSVRIHPIPLGIDTCYVLQCDGLVMIDGGAPKKATAFRKAMAALSLRPEEIRLIVLTHGHWDHIGSARDLKTITGAKIALHEMERDCLEKGLKPLPPGVTPWGRAFVGIMAVFMPLVEIPAAEVDVVLGDEGLSLAEFGIPGRVLSTPGHSSGSVSVLLETGEAFVGDLAMNGFPLRRGPGLPSLAEDLERARASLRLLFELGARTIYPAHGKPFSAEVLRAVVGARGGSPRGACPG